MLESGNMIGVGGTNSGNVTPITTHGVSGGGSSSRSSNKGTPPHPRPTQSTSSVSPQPAILAYHQPFLSLVLSCLKGQDDQRESLLSSIHNQLSQYLVLSKEVIFINKYYRSHVIISGNFSANRNDSAFKKDVPVIKKLILCKIRLH